MKFVLGILVGIATLFDGVIGSVATADDHRYQYVFSGVSHRSTHNVLALSVSGRQATLDIEVTNRFGVDVGSVDSVTISPGFMQRLLLPAEMSGDNSGDIFRTVRITSNERLWIMVRRNFPKTILVVPVVEQVLPTTPTTPTTPEPDKDDGSCPGGAKTC